MSHFSDVNAQDTYDVDVSDAYDSCPKLKAKPKLGVFFLPKNQRLKWSCNCVLFFFKCMDFSRSQFDTADVSCMTYVTHDTDSFFDDLAGNCQQHGEE